MTLWLFWIIHPWFAGERGFSQTLRRGIIVIGFPFKAGASIIRYSFESKVDCIALDWSVNLPWAIMNINKDIAIQGNLDPASLIPSHNDYLRENVLTILDIMKGRRFIFNVGHGLTPDCKIENVKEVISIVRNYDRNI